jgi:arsenite-transporting ATPase
MATTDLGFDLSLLSESDLEEEVPSLQNLAETKSLEWIFVGGKGGVGKTTTSCSIAVLLAKHRENVLIVSTDPAHNLSDAFSQQFTSVPTQVNGISNLFAMEIDPTVNLGDQDALDDDSLSFTAELGSAMPGIDEAMSFATLMEQVQNMNYSTIVFDTAPTGHTLRLLSFPAALEKAFDKLMTLKQKFGGMFSQVQNMMQNNSDIDSSQLSEEKLMGKFEKLRSNITKVSEKFRDGDKTTFVCVAIPEFLSLFETERLIQELSKTGIDSCNVVVNQVLFPEEGSECKKCNARVKMQRKYINQIFELYDDFHITLMPLLDEEIRGIPDLENFGNIASDVEQQETLQAKCKTL